MKEPRFPGFTAEMSLYKTNEPYSMDVTSGHAFARIRSLVQPAGGGPFDPHQCYDDCVKAGMDPTWCWRTCYEK